MFMRFGGPQAHATTRDDKGKGSPSIRIRCSWRAQQAPHFASFRSDDNSYLGTECECPGKIAIPKGVTICSLYLLCDMDQADFISASVARAALTDSSMSAWV
jgi:hypothetical protein